MFELKIGTVAHVTKLTRILSAGFKLENCIDIEQATSASSTLENIVRPLDTLEIGLREWIASDTLQVQRLIDGQHVIVDSESSLIGTSGDHTVLARSPSGKSFGILNVKLLESGKVKLHMKRGL